MKLLEIRNLDLYYGDHHALKDISLVINPHQVTALIGPSGCGKSTFLRCLNRMNDLIENCKITGNVLFERENVYHPKYDIVDLRTKIGMVFQQPNPFPMSIFDNVAYGLRCAGIKDKKYIEETVIESLIKAGLYDEVKDRLKSHASSLSGGQQQRLCIARAIALKPQVILMDEPTSALDPIATAKIEELIEELKKEFTIVIVTHSMQQAARISDQTVFFLMGEIIEAGPTPRIFHTPQDKRTEDYITGRFG